VILIRDAAESNGPFSSAAAELGRIFVTCSHFLHTVSSLFYGQNKSKSTKCRQGFGEITISERCLPEG
ncbi:MAG: hypothetical protein ACK58T_14630, partial [Phycisphaerae bacterium]